MFTRLIQVVIVSLISVYGVSFAWAQVMSSSNFQIDSQSVNFGGGLGTSTNFTVQSTMGEIATGDSSSSNFGIRAGYQQMLESFISVSSISDIILAPTLGLAGGTASGTVSFVVTTDNRAGYSVTLAAERSPALQSSVGVIANYMPAGASPDFLFNTTATQAHFGFTVEGRDVADRYRDNGVSCGAGTGTTTNTCFDRVGTTSQEILRSGAANHPGGATSSIRFVVGIGSTASVIAGSYTATTTITALAL